VQSTAQAATATNIVTDVAIIGAGPYGLSLAAFLRERGVDFKIFGSAMETWRTQMPKGMFLKSEGFASNLYDPAASLTLERFCADNGIPYADIGVPVALETFISYGAAFQQRFVPDLDERKVATLADTGSGFVLHLTDGTTVNARSVVVAVGISHFAYVPPVLSKLPSDFVSHSSENRDLARHKGRKVVVVGAGASAGDLAALLQQGGATVELVARASTLNIHPAPELGTRPLWKRLRYPRSGLGMGLKSKFYSDLPDVMHRLPGPLRMTMVRDHIPAPGWFTREHIVGKVPCHLGTSLEGAEVRDQSVVLHLSDRLGARSEFVADHVIAATGYRVDLARVGFLDGNLRARMRYADDMPLLNSNFESAVPELYFVGASAMSSFGPLLRFAYGARFAAQRLAGHFGSRS